MGGQPGKGRKKPARSPLGPSWMRREGVCLVAPGAQGMPYSSGGTDRKTVRQGQRAHHGSVVGENGRLLSG